MKFDGEACGRLTIAGALFGDPELDASGLHDLTAHESFGYIPVPCSTRTEGGVKTR